MKCIADIRLASVNERLRGMRNAIRNCRAAADSWRHGAKRASYDDDDGEEEEAEEEDWNRA